MTVQIVIVNASNALTDAEAAVIVPAMQTWDDTMLRPAWGFETCTYSFMPRGQLPAADDPRWPIFLNRHSTQPGALGWHADEGKIYGRVFVGDCLRYGISWTVDVSHEAAEMRGDPTTDQIFKMADGRIALKELCDPVEDDLFAIVVDNIKLSDFVLPPYFSDSDPGPYDYQGKLLGPCPTLTSGGYQSLYVDGNWTQLTAMYIGGPPSYRSSRYHNGLRSPRFVPTP